MKRRTREEQLAGNWMQGYEPPAGYYDEMLDSEGQPRAHWKGLVGRLGSIDSAGWQARERQLERLIQDNGITYNVYGEDGDNLRPWTLDMLPLVLQQAEFERLESALSQRAHLLNLILNDVYGRQTMLQSGRMNPYLVFANPAFLRPCHGLLPSNHKHIHLYAVDITRSPDGNWWVLADRVEAASGLGYALENRMLMSRVMPKVVWDSEIHSLQPFIQHYCRYIESLAPKSSDRPTVALLTAGPKNETYFEQSFLARNLGPALVEGGDLMVRGNHLYMKTIGGTQRVDAIWRRVDSSWCDPLELRNDSLLGVPGLVNAIRKGNVAVANSLGSGFVETPAMLAFLPWFSRNYLGENLEIPSVATWWCGQKSELDYVIANIDKLTIKPTFWEPNSRSFFGPFLASAEKEALIARMRQHPELYCGQEIVSNSTIPVRRDGRLRPRQFQLRVFLVPDGNSWKMMPGGLTRYAFGENDLVVSMQRGGQSKDTWVLRDAGRQSGKRATPSISSQAVSRGKSNDLPSRTAENLFWLGRYVERTEGLARILRALNNLLISDFGFESNRAVIPFLNQIVKPGADLSGLLDEERETIDFARAESIILESAYEQKNPESLIANLGYIERAAAKVKERLSVDIWKRLVGMRVQAVVPPGGAHSVLDENFTLMLDRVVDYLASFVGNLAENTTRSQGWHFLQIGRRIERGLSIGFLLRDALLHDAQRSETLMSSLVDWADSSITYRRRFLNTLDASNVLDLLCFDGTNPRSLAFQADDLRHTLPLLPHHSIGGRHPIDTIALRLYSRLGLTGPGDLLPKDKRSARKAVCSFFDAICDDLLNLSQSIEQYYFSHTAMSPDHQAQTTID